MEAASSLVRITETRLRIGLTRSKSISFTCTVSSASWTDPTGESGVMGVSAAGPAPRTARRAGEDTLERKDILLDAMGDVDMLADEGVCMPGVSRGVSSDCFWAGDSTRDICWRLSELRRLTIGDGDGGALPLCNPTRIIVFDATVRRPRNGLLLLVDGAGFDGGEAMRFTGLVEDVRTGDSGTRAGASRMGVCGAPGVGG